MGYHVEHHMFPLVPYHALPRLHELVKADMPRPIMGCVEAYREIIPAVLRQAKDPNYFVRRPAAGPYPSMRRQPMRPGWTRAHAPGRLAGGMRSQPAAGRRCAAF